MRLPRLPLPGRPLVGTCGFPRARKQVFSALSLVEVEQTFYEPPPSATLERWRQEAPPGFSFTLKAWQILTHPASSPTYKRTRSPLPEGEVGHFAPGPATEMAWERTLEAARALQADLVLIQTPPSFGPEKASRLKAFALKAPRGGFLLAWEWRGRWDEAEALALCGELELVPALDPFARQGLPAAELLYLRLHGGPGYRNRFTREELSWLAAQLEGRRAWVLFNNVSMWEDALAFTELLGGGSAGAREGTAEGG